MTAPVEVVEEFDIHELIREVIDTSGLADPGEIADAVMDKIGDSDLRTALHSVLRAAVREIFRGHRDSVLAASRAGVSRANQVRDWYVQTLQVRLHVGDSDGAPVWALFGDCSQAELEFVVNERREVARANALQAKRYEAVQSRMKAKRAKFVRDLSAEDLRSAMAAS